MVFKTNKLSEREPTECGWNKKWNSITTRNLFKYLQHSVMELQAWIRVGYGGFNGIDPYKVQRMKEKIRSILSKIMRKLIIICLMFPFL